MDLDKPIPKPRSLGKLRKAQNTKPRSPDMTGTLRLQRHTAASILTTFEEAACEEIICNIAGWANQDHEGQYLTIEISPKYEARQSPKPKTNSLAFIFDDQE